MSDAKVLSTTVDKSIFAIMVINLKRHLTLTYSLIGAWPTVCAITEIESTLRNSYNGKV